MRRPFGFLKLQFSVRHSAKVSAALVLLVGFTCLTTKIFAQTADSPKVLAADQAIERELQGGSKHLYTISAKTGDFVRVIADQRGIDVVVRIFAPDGGLLFERDTPNGSIGEESVAFIAAKENYRIEVSALDEKAPRGKYRIKLENPRRPAEADLVRIRAEQDFADGQTLRSTNAPDALKQAQVKFEASLAGFQKLGDKYREANTLATLAFVVLTPTDGAPSLAMLDRARRLTREIADKHLETFALINTGDVYGTLKDTAKAMEFYAQAAELAKNTGESDNEILALSSAAAVCGSDKQWQKAIDLNLRVAELHRRAANRDGEARTLNIIGVLYSSAGNRTRAVEFYAQAGAIFRELKNKESEALTLANAGIDYQALGDGDKALAANRQALSLYDGNAEKSAETLEQIINIRTAQKDRKTIIKDYETLLALYRRLQNREKIASTLNLLGVAFVNGGDRQKAFAPYNESLAVYREIKNRAGEAQILSNLGGNYYAVKEAKKSLECYEAALKIYRELDDLSEVAEVSENIVSVNKELGDFDRAMSVYETIPALYVQLKDEKKEAVIYNRIGVLADDAYEKTKKPMFDRKAVANYETALKMHRRLKDKPAESLVLKNLGAHYIKTDNYVKAIEYLQGVLPMWVELKLKSGEAETLKLIGQSYDGLDDSAPAIEFYLKALAVYRTLDEPGELAQVYNSLAVAYEGISQLRQALENYRLAVPLFRQANDRLGTVVALKNIGKMLHNFQESKEALANYGEALKIAREIKDRSEEAELLSLSASILQTLGETAKADEYWQLASKIAAEDNDQENLARILNHIALPLAGFEASKADREIALKSFQKSLEINRKLGRRYSESNNLQGIALVYYVNGDYRTSFDYLQQALPIAKSLSDKREEAKLLSNMMILLKYDDKAALAIFYGKQSVNLYQQLRASLKGVEKDLQDSFLKSNEDTYRKLAELLINAGRLPEAQQILGMLKEEELSGFVKRDAKEIESLSKRADLRADEKSALERYNAFSSKVTEIGAELSQLDARKRRLTTGEIFAEQTRYDELSAQLKDANTAFRVFLEKELAAELGKDKKKEIEQDRAMQGKLKNWGEGTVALSTILGEDRYRVILTTANAQIDGKTEIKAADLNRKIFAFREALLNPAIDPKPLGKELYDVLIKPIEKDLAAANAKTLLWSLDGTLRYIPIAALWDGNQYVVQKYQTVIVTSTTRQSLQAEVNKNWRILGAGVSKASEVTDANTAQKYSFDELKSVAQELSAVVGGQSPKNNTTGISLIDAAFTENALKQELMQLDADKRRFNVVHFATHFRLGSDTADSFLLLGNNKSLTLAEVADSPEMNLNDVELVTLSACNTGFGGLENAQTLAANNGKEVDSLAQFIELRGAKSVLATLWSVADESTAVLMGEFYELRKENQAWTKAETLRQAQLKLLYGKYQPEQIAERNRSEAVRFGASAKTMPKFVKDANAPFAHPFYWSPFVLIGNWR